MKNTVRLCAGILCLGYLAAGGSLLRSPYVQNVQGDHATILWAASTSGAGTVRLSDGRTQTTVSADSRRFTSAETNLAADFYLYQADLTGLSPATSYTYQVLIDGEIVAPAAQFTTAGPGPFTFLALGDSGSPAAEPREISALMNAEPGVSFVLHTGDLAHENGTFAQFETNFFAPFGSLMRRLPFFPTPGNHEYWTANAAPYLALTSVPATGVPPEDRGRYYSFDWGDAHFASVDANLLSTDAEDRMMAWLDRDLQRTRKFWKIAYWHQTPYPSGHHLGDPVCERARTTLNPVLERNGVQLVLNGHEHSYQRSMPLVNGAPVDPGFGTTYITSAGGGGAMQLIGTLPTTAVSISAFHYLAVSVDGSQLSIRAVGLSGVEIDRLVLTPKPQLKVNSVLNGGDFSSGLSPGSLVSIFGGNLAVREARAQAWPLPTLLGETSITLGGKSLPLLYVSPRQINAQLPFDATSAGTLEVQTTNGSAQQRISLAPAAPSIIWVASGDTIVSAANPAHPGDSLTIYATGLGSVNEAMEAGVPAPATPIAAASAVQVLLGTKGLQPAFAGLAPGTAGLYQVNMTLPFTLSPGTMDLRLVVAGVQSRPVTLPVAGSAPDPALSLHLESRK